MSRVLVALLSIAAAIAVVGGGLRVLDDRAAPPIVISDPIDDLTIAVFVEGAVASPGLYELPADARYADAVAAAGGMTDAADLSGVNPARRVRDEDRLVVPSLEAVADAGTASNAAPADPAAGAPGAVPAEASGRDGAGQPGEEPTEGTVVDLNSASIEELDGLPGIGPVLAARILAVRDERGGFALVDDLAVVEGISRRMVDDLRPLVSAGP